MAIAEETKKQIEEDLVQLELIVLKWERCLPGIKKFIKDSREAMKDGE